jgi:hypothetical protein
LKDLVHRLHLRNVSKSGNTGLRKTNQEREGAVVGDMSYWKWTSRAEALIVPAALVIEGQGRFIVIL